MNTKYVVDENDPIFDKLNILISRLHSESYTLCKKSFGRYFSNAGNVGIFCQTEEDFQLFTDLKLKITKPSDNPLRKYFELLNPIVISASDDIPAVVYTHLYIRKYDSSPYGKHIGDIDFYVDQSELEELLAETKKGLHEFAREYLQEGIGTLIEISDSSNGTLAYISTKDVTERIKFRHILN